MTLPERFKSEVMERALTRNIESCLAGLVLSVAGMVTCAQAQTAEPIKVGFIGEMTGSYSFGGKGCLGAVRIAAQEINAHGGVLHRPLDYIVVDDQTDPAQAAAAMRTLDTQAHVPLVTGLASSDTALAAYGYAEQNHVPLLIAIAANELLTKPGTRWTFKMATSGAGTGYATAKFIEKLKPGARIAMMTQDISIAHANMLGLKYQVPRSGLTVVKEIWFPQGATDASIQAAQIAAEKPDYVVVVAVGAFDPTVTNALLDIGFKPEQIVHVFGYNAAVLGWGSASVGSYYGTFFDAGIKDITEEGRKFIQTYKEQTGISASYGENYCYNAAYVIKQAIENAGSLDRTKIRDGLRSVNMSEKTSHAPIAFNENGARKEFMYYMQLMQDNPAQKSFASRQVEYFEWNLSSLPVYDVPR